MTDLCPHCGRPMPDDGPGDYLLAACRDLNIFVAYDGTVSAMDAARLLNRSEKTLRNWRTEYAGPPYRKHGGRVWYAIEDLENFSAECPDMSREE